MMNYKALPEWILPYLVVTLLFSSVSAVSIKGYGIPYSIGLSLCWFVLLYRKREIKLNIRPLSQCTLGIYLLHPFILMVLTKFTFAPPAVKAISAFVTSTILIWLVKNYFPKWTNYAV